MLPAIAFHFCWKRKKRLQHEQSPGRGALKLLELTLVRCVRAAKCQHSMRVFLPSCAAPTQGISGLCFRFSNAAANEELGFGFRLLQVSLPSSPLPHTVLLSGAAQFAAVLVLLVSVSHSSSLRTAAALMPLDVKHMKKSFAWVLKSH